MPESTITHPRFSRKRVSNICLSHDAQQPRATAAQSEIITSENQNFNAGAVLSYSLCSECTDLAEPKLVFSSIFRKKVLAFSRKMMYYFGVRFVGQAVKTPPSHGGNRGSIPLRTVCCQKFSGSVFYITENCVPCDITTLRGMRTRAMQKSVAKTTAPGTRVLRTELFVLRAQRDH